MGTGFVEVTLKPKSETLFFSFMENLAKNIHLVAGRHDFIVEVTPKSRVELLTLLERIERQEFVRRARFIAVKGVIVDHLVRTETISGEERKHLYRKQLGAFIGIYLKKPITHWPVAITGNLSVKRLFTVEGPYNAFAMIMGDNMEEIWGLILRFRELMEIKNTETFFILRSLRRDIFGDDVLNARG